MDVEIAGIDEKHIPEIRKAIDFYSEILFTPRMNKSLTLYIQFKKRMPDGSGMVTWIGENHRPKSFFMEVKHGKLNEVLKIIAHELVHVKQFATGRMKDYKSSNMTMFDGELYTQNPTEEDYWLQPFEIEAFGMEVGLYQLLSMKHHNNNVPKHHTSK